MQIYKRLPSTPLKDESCLELPAEPEFEANSKEIRKEEEENRCICLLYCLDRVLETPLPFENAKFKYYDIQLFSRWRAIDARKQFIVSRRNG